MSFRRSKDKEESANSSTQMRARSQGRVPQLFRRFSAGKSGSSQNSSCPGRVHRGERRWRAPMKVAPEQELILWWVSFLMLVYDRVGASGPRVQIAKAAITGDYIRNTFFYRSVLAVPVSISSDAIDCAPGRIAIG